MGFECGCPDCNAEEPSEEQWAFWYFESIKKALDQNPPVFPAKQYIIDWIKQLQADKARLDKLSRILDVEGILQLTKCVEDEYAPGIEIARGQRYGFQVIAFQDTLAEAIDQLEDSNGQ